ncbi:Coatomer subunit epsilon-1 [Zea mays]|uniref:Coatomer subunit epsilon-1 n=2 Tax=Zea mays TaxID=4577 RepID=A0A3L6FNH5_MAIZE|nr:Coatomer subunit epsilon-1 [Zea mays]
MEEGCDVTSDWIISPNWLKESVREGQFVEEAQYVLEDEEYRMQYKSELRDAVMRAKERHNSLFAGYKHIQPSFDVLLAIIKSTGGNFIQAEKGIAVAKVPRSTLAAISLCQPGGGGEGDWDGACADVAACVPGSAHLCQHMVISEIDSSIATSLQAVKLLALYLTGDKEGAISSLKEWLSDSATGSNLVLRLIAGIIFMREQDYNEALKHTHSGGTLDLYVYLFP